MEASNGTRSHDTSASLNELQPPDNVQGSYAQQAQGCGHQSQANNTLPNDASSAHDLEQQLPPQSINIVPQQQQQQQQQQPFQSQPLPESQPIDQSQVLPTVASALPQEIEAHAQSINPESASTDTQQKQQQSPLHANKTTVTKVKLIDEVNLFNWLKADVFNHLAEKARNSVDQFITVLDPGMKEYLYSGGSINILVISQTQKHVASIRDAFQDTFGRATVVAARYEPEAVDEHPVKLANGLESVMRVGKEKISQLRADTNKIPQNQVIIALQPAIVTLGYVDAYYQKGTSQANKDDSQGDANAVTLNSCLLPKQFLTYCMILEDPVLAVTVHSYSQFIPIDEGIVQAAEKNKVADSGFSRPIDELMIEKLNLKSPDAELEQCDWLNEWVGLSETHLIHNLSMTLANAYKRKRIDYVS